MPTNTQIAAALQPNPVPPDQECIPGNTTALLQVIAANMGIVSTTSQINGGQSDSIAAQALQTANNAIAIATQALNSIPQRRSSSTLIPLNTGDQVQALNWTPSMPSTNYEVRVTLYGDNAAAGVFYGFRVIEGTRTVDNCQVYFDNIPANSKFAFVVEALTT